MVNIEMNQNDRGLLLRILDNYKDYRYKDYQKGIINSKELNYDYETLRHLIGLIKGTEKVDEDYLLTSKAYREKMRVDYKRSKTTTTNEESKTGEVIQSGKKKNETSIKVGKGRDD